MLHYWLSLALFCSRDRTDPDKSYIVLDRWNILWPLPVEKLFYFLTHSRTIFCSFVLSLKFLAHNLQCISGEVHSILCYPPGTILLRSLPQDVNNRDSLMLELITYIMEHFKHFGSGEWPTCTPKSWVLWDTSNSIAEVKVAKPAKCIFCLGLWAVYWDAWDLMSWDGEFKYMHHFVHLEEQRT